MNKVLITPKSFQKFREKPIKMLQEKGYEVIENQTGRTLTEDELIEYGKSGVVGVIVGVDPLPASVLTNCDQLKAISKYGVGTDNIDLGKADELGIQVSKAMGTNNISVAELAVGLMFESARKLSQSVQAVKNFGWGRTIGSELTGKKVALIGGGQIGKEVAKRCRGLQMEVSIYDPYFNDDSFLIEFGVSRSESLDDLLADADFVSLHLPVTDDTKHIMNAKTLSQMKETAILINTARGELVDEKALLSALQNGEIAVAAQDVYSQEPPEQGDSLVSLPNFILTPHIGAFTNEAVERMAIVSTENLITMLQGNE
ncbi:phosphoglycerate dehydrogenase [Sporosarcina obsidiansis]|uniref:phosphoglycerate dehydrogenase n=1 Tax=Sporosarcina obsidiansis TaxID=2660748 RepID=UPI00129B596E|nr:phosphoglycerate dehydrogenase [Sporosarcina obsidiansis]